MYLKSDTTNSVTSLTFTQYDPANYTLDPTEGLKLSSLNRILLNLFNNDLYAFTLLVGKMRGLWWKYWFADNAIKGYALGDMVIANNIQEVTFLSRYWEGVKQIADHQTTVNLLPRFVSTDEDVMEKYLNALSDCFHLGNRFADRQLYISLKDNNKDTPSITNSWQPYIVTTEELQRREYYLNDILEDLVQQHNSMYHSALDALDEYDKAYEIDGQLTSLYDSVLAEYLPVVGLSDKEHSKWVEFVTNGASGPLLGLGAIAFDFLHITKPLGTDTHRLETWIRTDGHVSIKGYVSTDNLTELIPDQGTMEYNKWKMGGMRRYGFRLDYALKDAISNMFVSTKVESEDGTESTTVEPAGDLRLLRQLGFTRSPALKSVTKAHISPDAAQLLSPALIKGPTVQVRDWTYFNGQALVCEVPSATQNIQVEIEGMMREGDFDFSLYDIHKPGGDHLQWVYDLIMDYQYPRAIIKAAQEEGLEDPDNWPLLLDNMEGLMTRICSQVLDHPTVVSFMQLRAVELGPLADILTSLRGCADDWVHNADPTSAFGVATALLKRLYGYWYEYVADDRRLGFLYSYLAELFSTAITVHQSNVVMLVQIKEFLKPRALGMGACRVGSLEELEQLTPENAYVGKMMFVEGSQAIYRCVSTTSEGASPVQWEMAATIEGDFGGAEAWDMEIVEAIQAAENLVLDLVKQSRNETASHMSDVTARLKKLHNQYLKNRELVSRPLDNIPEADVTSDAYVEARTQVQASFVDHLKEMFFYILEVKDALESSVQVADLLTSYLGVEWLDEATKIYLMSQLDKLNNSVVRYKRLNLQVCLGYQSYVRQWTTLLGIDGTSPLAEDYVVDDLLAEPVGQEPKLSLVWLEQLLRGV